MAVKLFSRSCGYITYRKITGVSGLCELRFYCNPLQSSDARIRFYKRLFSTFMFGTTFATVMYIKRKRDRELNHILNNAKLIVYDENFEATNARSAFAYEGFVFDKSVLKSIREMASDFKARVDDIYVISFPKSGITWVQEIVYLIMTDIDLKKARSHSIETRFPYMEYGYPGVKALEKAQSPRFIKSHLPYSLLPSDVRDKKIIYVMRNPKDIVVSYYYFARMANVMGYRGSFSEFFEKFLNDQVFYSPFWKHVTEFWEHREDSNILFIKYENLQKNLVGEIVRIAKFLDRMLSEEEILVIARHCSFKEMSENSSVNYSHWDELGLRNKFEAKFLRKGITGDWKDHFHGDMNERMNDWINKRISCSGLIFDYEIQNKE